MKNFLFILALVSMFVIDACKEAHNPVAIPTYTSTPDNYSSMNDFFAKNASPMQLYTVDAVAGGTFTTPQGTNVTVGANAFVDQNGHAITSGSVTIEFKDIYKKSDMLFNLAATQMNTGAPIKSGGEYYIKATQNGNALLLNYTVPIVVTQPLFGQPSDPNMVTMINPSSTGNITNGWVIDDSLGNNYDTLHFDPTSYIFKQYQMNAPVDSGSWNNSDNPLYFSAYTQTTLNIVANDSFSVFGTYVFLIFKNINSMVHVYCAHYNTNHESYLYYFAPLGLPCTVVAVGVKNGQPYSSFTPITISANQTVNFTLSPTTTDAFKAAVKALD